MSTNFELESYVPFLLNQTGSRIATSFTQWLRRYGLNIPAWRVLASLHQSNGQRIGEIAAGTGIEVWTVSRVAKSLVNQGLINRAREQDDDARAVRIYLTDDGESLLENLIPQAQKMERIPLDGFSQEETEQLQYFLRKLYRNTEKFTS